MKYKNRFETWIKDKQTADKVSALKAGLYCFI